MEGIKLFTRFNHFEKLVEKKTQIIRANYVSQEIVKKLSVLEFAIKNAIYCQNKFKVNQFYDDYREELQNLTNCFQSPISHKGKNVDLFQLDETEEEQFRIGDVAN